MTVFALLLALIAGCGGFPKLGFGKKKTAETKENPQVIINTKLGLAYLQQGDLDKAVEKLKKALELNSGYTEAYHYLAETYRRQGKAAEANKAYMDALHLAPDDPAIHNNYGVFLCGTGHYTEAEEQFLIAATNPKYHAIAQAYENAGLCMMKLGDQARAELYFRQALQHNPDQSKSIYQSAKINLEKGRLKAAEDYLRRYESLSEHNAKSLWLAVRIYRALNQPDKVASYSRRLIEGYRDSEEYKKLTGLDQLGKELPEEPESTTTVTSTTAVKEGAVSVAGENDSGEDEFDSEDESFDRVGDEAADKTGDAAPKPTEEVKATTIDETDDFGSEVDSFDAVTDEQKKPENKLDITNEEMKVPAVTNNNNSTGGVDPAFLGQDLNGDGIPDNDLNQDGIPDDQQGGINNIPATSPPGIVGGQPSTGFGSNSNNSQFTNSTP